MNMKKPKTKNETSPVFTHFCTHASNSTNNSDGSKKELKISMSVDERVIYTEFTCDSENVCNCAVNNTNYA